MVLATPRPTLYYNFYVGECKDLIFGVSLVDYATARGLSDGEVTKVVKLSVAEIDKRGLDSEGIYRVCRRILLIFVINRIPDIGEACQCTRGVHILNRLIIDRTDAQITQRIERDENQFAYNPVMDDVYSISSTLKVSVLYCDTQSVLLCNSCT